MRKTARSRRKLALWSALPPYLGGKRRLCPLIFREIDSLLPRRLWAGKTFLDGFLGGGSVSLYAKAMGFKVVSTDIAERALVVGRGLIENSRVKLTREDVIRILIPNPEPAMRIERELSPAVFTPNVARFIDRALAQARVTPHPAKSALLKMLAIRVALLEHPMSQVRKGTIHRMASGEYEAITESCVHHYVGGLRLTRPDRVWAIAQQINAGVFQGEGTVHRGSVLDLLPSIPADVAYFDPPYPGVMSYEKEYRVIDEILEGASKPTSPFTARDGAAMIDGLLELAQHIPIWLLSLGNAVVTIGELEEKMRRLGRETRAIEIKYQHLPAVATDEKKDANREYLVVGWDPEAAGLSDLRRCGAVREDVEQPGNHLVALDHGVDESSAPAAAPLGLSDHPEEQLQSSLGLEALPSGAAQAGSVLQDGMDEPAVKIDERTRNRDGEVRVIPNVSHGEALHPEGGGFPFRGGDQ